MKRGLRKSPIKIPAGKQNAVTAEYRRTLASLHAWSTMARRWAAFSAVSWLILAPQNRHTSDDISIVCLQLGHSKTSSAIHATSRTRPSFTSRRPALPIPPTSAPKPSFSFSTMSASISASSMAFITSTPKKDAGTQAGPKTIWDTGRVTGKDIFRCRRRIIIRTCAQKWC